MAVTATVNRSTFRWWPVALGLIILALALASFVPALATCYNFLIDRYEGPAIADLDVFTLPQERRQNSSPANNRPTLASPPASRDSCHRRAA